ncbi:MAG: hypothetical protein FJ102_01840, partial [Deltaproteobacteria bacterium]|nr:hypothetical protein [Deltaproteobacteria bacterium]
MSLLLASRALALDILLYEESSSRGYAGDALDLLGLSYTTASSSSFTSDVTGGTYELIVVDMPSTEPSGSWQNAVSTHVSGGGKAIMSHGQLSTEPTIQSVFKAVSSSALTTPGAIYRWDSAHDIFNSPYAVGNLTTRTDTWTYDGDEVRATGSGDLLGGYASSTSTTR